MSRLVRRLNWCLVLRPWFLVLILAVGLAVVATAQSPVPADSAASRFDQEGRCRPMSVSEEDGRFMRVRHLARRQARARNGGASGYSGSGLASACGRPAGT
jgi:hypothetical protein